PSPRRRALAVGPAPGSPQRIGAGHHAPAPGRTGRPRPDPPPPPPPHLRPRLALRRRQRRRPHAPGRLAGPGHALPLRRQRRRRTGPGRPQAPLPGGPAVATPRRRPCGWRATECGGRWRGRTRASRRVKALSADEARRGGGSRPVDLVALFEAALDISIVGLA